MTASTLKIGGRTIGLGHPCFIAAEIGINHNGELRLALDMIDAAAEAGVDGVKFQNYRTEDFIADRTLEYEYVSQGKTVVETQYEMFKRHEMPREWLAELKRRCTERDVEFFSTPTSEQCIQDLLDVGVALFKNGSDYLGHLPLIRAFAKTGLATVLSTGMADVEEVDAAVAAYRDGGGERLVLLHCTSSYPTPREEANLRRMVSLAERYGCLVGFSDHTEGWMAAAVSAALGAVFIEKHFTLDRDLPGPDHGFSSTPGEMATLVARVREAEVALGSPDIKPSSSEELGRRSFRLSCRAARHLEAGTIIGRDDVTTSRPGDGLPPSELQSVIGRRLVKSLEAGEPLVPEVIEKSS